MVTESKLGAVNIDDADTPAVDKSDTSAFACILREIAATPDTCQYQLKPEWDSFM
jgi:hypothetical protein